MNRARMLTAEGRRHRHMCHCCYSLDAPGWRRNLKHIQKRRERRQWRKEQETE